MLILTRKLGESVIIGDQQIRITVTEIKGKQVKIAIDAPREVVVCREEIYDKFMKKRDSPAGCRRASAPGRSGLRSRAVAGPAPCGV